MTAMVHQHRLVFPSPRQLLVLLTGCVALLLVLSTAGQIAKHVFGHTQLWGFVELFYVDAETSVPTWDSSAAWGLAAALCGLIAATRVAERERHRWEWGAVTVMLVLLSADEIAGFHEHNIPRLREMWGGEGWLYYSWVVPGLVLVALCAAALSRWLWALPGRYRLLLVCSGTIFLTGAMGLETVSGWWASSHGEENLVYALIVTAEETCEMSGVALLVYTMHDYIFRQLSGVQVEIG
jgi:hypothetical protein